jgi:hypothetical protein
VLERGHDDVVPHRAGLRTQDVAVDADARAGQPDHRQVGDIVGQHHVGSACQHQRPLRGVGSGVQGAQRGDDLLGGLAGDHAARDRADAQRGQRREGHVLGNRDTP